MSIAIDIVESRVGISLYINDKRVAGPDPGETGEIVHSWHAKTQNMIRAIGQLKMLRTVDLEEKLNASAFIVKKVRARPGFPKPISLSGRAIGWFEHEVDDYLLGCERHE